MFAKSLTHCLHLLAGSQALMQAQSAQSLRASATQQHYALWSACFRRRVKSEDEGRLPLHRLIYFEMSHHRGGCSKHSFCRSRQRSASRCKIIVKKKCVSRGCRNLKRWARKRFPPSPLPRGTPTTPFQKI